MFKFRSNSGQKCSPEPEPEFRSIYGLFLSLFVSLSLTESPEFSLPYSFSNDRHLITLYLPKRCYLLFIFSNLPHLYNVKNHPTPPQI